MNLSNARPLNLLSLVVYLVPQQDAMLDIYLGRLLHAALLDFVGQYDPKMSQVLHDSS